MKKYGLLVLIVAAMSTTAWASPFASVKAPECAPACEDVMVHVDACLPYDCEEMCTKVCVRGNMIIVDMFYGCEDCKCGGATCISECVNVGELCPGMYSVVVRIYCKCEGSCCSRPRVCALGSTFLRVGCDGPCMP